ncbi:CD209 antigen-like protein C isoform X2 [Danio rerio]|uniref:CD209 antigen-like protein C isoform X2 n=1 Tax=Danio rerio TaxID=7955 RepID=A0AB32T8R1_DANRE
MESIYENSAIFLSTVASSEECSPNKDTNALADSGSLKEQLSAQKLNSKTLRDDLMRELEELKDNYTHVREHLVLCVAMKEEFHDLTSRYKILRDLLSYYDAQSCNVSANGWTACRGQLYYFSTSKLNWFSSRDACVSRGADLVTITSQSEQDFLVSKITESHWIGLSDLETEGRWVWVNNQTLNETGIQSWFKGNPTQPNNRKKNDPSGENCVSQGDIKEELHTWFDSTCKMNQKFICEKRY